MLLKGRYEIQSDLSQRSRMALDRKSNQHVVIREIKLQGLKEWSLLTKLEEEAKLLATVSHDAVPRLIDSFTLDATSPDPRFFLVQQYISGIALSDKKVRLTQEELLSISKRLLETISSLHRLAPPLLHGDISPERILQKPDGSLVLVGFGAAPVPEYPCHPDFAAPERMGQRATIAAEVYSAGAVIYWMATHEAYHGDLSLVVDSTIRRLLEKMLAIDPQQRPLSVSDALSILVPSNAMILAPQNQEMILANEESQMSRYAGAGGAITSLIVLLATGASGAALATMLPLLLLSLYFATKRPKDRPA
jgi:serine/threonine protein kinase